MACVSERVVSVAFGRTCIPLLQSPRRLRVNRYTQLSSIEFSLVPKRGRPAARRVPATLSCRLPGCTVVCTVSPLLSSWPATLAACYGGMRSVCGTNTFYVCLREMYRNAIYVLGIILIYTHITTGLIIDIMHLYII
jgi:hypothetical protein